MLKFRNMVCLLLLGVACQLSAQQNAPLQPPDSIKIQTTDSTVSLQADSVIIDVDKKNILLPQLTDSIAKNMAVEKKPFKPSPQKAILYSAIFPGLGQIYNRKYWKLPIIYGGFVGFSYLISWNNGHYQDYLGAQRAILDDDPSNDHLWEKLLFSGTTPESVNKQEFANVLRDRRNYFRYYRDLSIILSVVWYGLGIVDAYVDAQLFEFDVSPDLSLRVEPAIFPKSNINYMANSYGFRCSFSF